MTKYIITDDMIGAWKAGCINWKTQDEIKCHGCKFDGVGFRKGCCEFDNIEVMKMFTSNEVKE